MEPPPDDCEALGNQGGRQAPHGWDERHLARLAAAQDGVVALWQLSALGLTPRARQRRLEQHRLRVEHRGVYAVGGAPLSERGTFRAAVLACGDDALLSGRACARLLGLWERPVDELDVTVPRPRRPRHRAIRIHQTGVLLPADRTHVRGIACTSVARLLVDLAGTEAAPALEAVFERAERRRLIRVAEVEDVLRRRMRAPGTAALRALLDTHRPQSGPTRALQERRLLAGLRRAGLPQPVVNGALELDETISPDLMWPDRRVLVELDSLEFHGTRPAMRRDRRRDRRALLAGWLALRFTWHDVEQDLAAVLRDIREALDNRQGRQPPHDPHAL